MIIILEGFDESGKSTLANKLAGRLGIKVVHPGPKPIDIDDAKQMAARQFGLMTFAQHVNLILDRVTCISSHCYMMNITNEFKSEQAAINVLESQGHVKVIRCISYPAALKQTENDTSDSLEHASRNRHQIIQNYQSVFMNIGHHVYNYKDPDAFYKVAKYIGFDMFDK